jgi:hypothetical protein
MTVAGGSRSTRWLAVAVAAAAVGLLGGCGDDGNGSATAPDPSSRSDADSSDAGPVSTDIEGVILERSPGRGHTTEPVEYPEHPPSGGDHQPVWQNCGVYSQAVRDENAVHALEHGAVWITYRPDTAPDTVAELEDLVGGHDKALLTPYPGIDEPIVVVAWEHRLELESADDPRLARFLEVFEGAKTSPEPAAPCSGGTGNPSP